MKFFLPETGDDEDVEQVYATLASAAGCEVPPDGERIYSVTYMHDGIEYVATVGKRRQATQPSRSRARAGRPAPQPRRFPSGGVVSAIFAGTPYMVWEVPGGPRDWVNPAMVGNNPWDVVYFDAE